MTTQHPDPDFGQSLPPLDLTGWVIAVRLDKRMIHVGRRSILPAHLGDAATEYEFFTGSGIRLKLITSQDHQTRVLFRDSSDTSFPVTLNSDIRTWFAGVLGLIKQLPPDDADRIWVLEHPVVLGTTLRDAAEGLGWAMELHGPGDVGTYWHNLAHRITGTH